MITGLFTRYCQEMTLLHKFSDWMGGVNLVYNLDALKPRIYFFNNQSPEYYPQYHYSCH